MQDGSEWTELRSLLSSCGLSCVLLELLIVAFWLTRDAMLTFSSEGWQGKVQVINLTTSLGKARLCYLCKNQKI